MNVALNKPATQSTLEFFSFSFNWDASYAVDGDSSPVWPCSSTDGWLENNTNAWWKVDLEGDYRIEAVTIQNRGDCCGTCTVMCLSIVTPKLTNFQFVLNGKLIILDVPKSRHIMAYS